MYHAVPRALPRQSCDRPIGARFRHDAAKARRLRYRRFHRARLPVTVLTVVGPHEATIRGITLFGACLDGGRRLRRREMIALRLPSGNRITARVRWRLGARSGVMFATPVADFARLIGEGALVQSLHRRRRVRAASARPRFAAAECATQEGRDALARLRAAVARAWTLIEQALAARMMKRGRGVRRFD